MKSLFLILAVLQVCFIKAQQLAPGGVQGACLWEITELKSPELAQWKSNLKSHSGNGFFISGNNRVINNNPALFFNAESLGKTIDLGKLASFSLFTVCQENDTLSETIIVSLENDSSPETVLTNQRMASLDIIRYSNYVVNKNSAPKIYSYSQNKSKDPAVRSHRLLLGRPPHNGYLPVSAFKGTIPEFILFDRYLSNSERQKVESYLALKYGISLNQDIPVSYYNSRGGKIWDADIHFTHNNNVTGIGKDNLSGLNQKISENTRTPGIMKMGYLNEPGDNSFVIWGDNGGALRFADSEGIRPLMREWKITTCRSQGDALFAETAILALNEINPFREGETCWMMIDRSATGKYPFKQTDYILCQPMVSQRGSIYFNPLVLDTDSSGSDIVTLLAAPEFFTRSSVIGPTCSSAYSGTIQTEIVGGKPPFKIMLKSILRPDFKQYTINNSGYHTFDAISQGSYILEVTDANNISYNEKINVFNTRFWQNKLSGSYTLSEGENLTLDAAAGMPAADFSYTWTLPDGVVLGGETIHISKPGSYLLSVTDDHNCNSLMEIKVKQSGKGSFKSFELFPNPANGWFVIRISLQHVADVSINITDNSGRAIIKALLQNDNYYWYSGNIQKSGIYFISLTSVTETETLKLIVN